MMTLEHKQASRNEYFVKELSTKGNYTFSLKDFITWSKKSETACRAFLRRSKKKGLIAAPIRGFYVIIPPEYSSIGCLPPEQFIDNLMHHLGQEYYIGLLSALRLYGISHQQPQVLQVVSNKKRPDIKCGKVQISFIKNKQIKKTPVNKLKTPRGFISVSTIEASITDLFSYPKHSGGLNNIATILLELSKQRTEYNINKIIKILPNISVAQKLGYILDRILKKHKLSAPLKTLVDKKAKHIIPLMRSGNRKSCNIDKKWKIYINTDIEADI